MRKFLQNVFYTPPHSFDSVHWMMAVLGALNLTRSTPQPKKNKKIIIGGGLGGTTLALQLKNNPRYDVILIEKNKFFAYSPLLSKLDPEIASCSYTALFANSNVTVIHATATDIDLHNKMVMLSNGQIVFGDECIITTGSRANYFGNKKISDFTTGLKTTDDLNRIVNLIKNGAPEKPIAIVGAGLAGIALAAELAKRKIEVVVIEGAKRILPACSEKLAEAVREELNDSNITFQFEKTVSDADIVMLREQYEAVIWTAGVLPNTELFLQDYPHCLDKRKQVQVNEYLELCDYHNVSSFGDIATCAPPTAQATLQAAHYLKKRFENGKTLPFQFVQRGVCVPLGESAVCEMAGMIIRGNIAAVIENMVHSYSFPGTAFQKCSLFYRLSERMKPVDHEELLYNTMIP